MYIAKTGKFTCPHTCLTYIWRLLGFLRVRKTIFLVPLGMISVLRKTIYLPSPFPLEEREKFLRKNWKLLDLTPVGLVITAVSEFVPSKFTADGGLATEAKGGYIQ